MKLVARISFLFLCAVASIGCQETDLNGFTLGEQQNESGEGGDGSIGSGGDDGGVESGGNDTKLTEGEKARCPAGNAANLKLLRVTGAGSRIELSSSEPVAILITTALARATLELKGQATALCVYARGARSEITATIESQVSAFHYEARGNGNELEVNVKTGGSLAKGKALLWGNDNELEIGGNGTIACPEVDDRGKDNEVECMD